MAARLMLKLDAISLAALASQTAMAKAISDQMVLVKTHGDLTGLAKMCSVLCGGGMDPTINWSVIRPRHQKLTHDYFGMLMNAIPLGPGQVEIEAFRLEKWRNGYDNDIKAKFAKAEGHNDQMIRKALAGFQTARAVRIAALGTLAVLSGVGGVVGTAGTISAFGVQTGVAGIGFSQGLLFGIGSKAAYTVSTNWTKATSQIAGIVVVNGLKDGVQPVAQDAVQLGIDLATYQTMRRWARELGLADSTARKIDALQARLGSLQAQVKPHAGTVGSLNRQLGKQQAVQAKNAGAVVKAKMGTPVGKVIRGGLPVVWLATDLWGVYTEASDDMKLLDL